MGPAQPAAGVGQTWPVGPLNVTDQQTTLIPFPRGTGAVVACNVLNLSGLALLVAGGSAAGVWIMPGAVVTLPVSAQPVAVRAQAVSGGGATTGQIVATYLDIEALAGYSISPGQLAVVNSSGTVTISGPVTIAGTVPVNVYTSQSQTLASLPAQAAGSVTVPLPAFANSVGLIWNNAGPSSLTTGTLVATGVQTGITYFSGTAGISQNCYVSPVYFDVANALDTQLTLSWNTPLLLPLEVVAYGDRSPTNTPSSPLSVAITDPMPKRFHQANPGGTSACPVGSTAILPAPPGGYLWDLRTITINAGTAAANAAQFIYARGTTSGSFLIGSYALATGIWQTENFYDFFLGEGITIQNSLAVPGTCFAWVRQVPLAQALT
jgi:hypothetical protein